MSAKLAAYPDEKELLIDALRRGIPDRILEHAGSDDYAEKLASMSQEIAQARGIDPEAATGVVSTWSEALNRPVGYQKRVVPDRVYPEEAKLSPVKEQTLKLIMLIIAGAGGFLGTALGAGAANLIMLATNVAVEGTQASGGHRGVTMVVWAIAIKMGIAGLVGGVGAVVGWVMGRGDERPWAGFATAFGSGFTSALILVSFGLSLIRMVEIGAAVFGATFTIAYRGGYKG